MKPSRAMIHCLALTALVGCASTKVTERQTYQHGRLPRPDRILVYDFATTYADLPSWSEPARRYDATMTTASDEVIAKGRELGSKVANNLVEEIREMGISDVLSARIGVSWNGIGMDEGDHTLTKVPVFAGGPGSELFDAPDFDNTDVG